MLIAQRQTKSAIMPLTSPCVYIVVDVPLQVGHTIQIAAIAARNTVPW